MGEFQTWASFRRGRVQDVYEIRGGRVLKVGEF